MRKASNALRKAVAKRAPGTAQQQPAEIRLIPLPLSDEIKPGDSLAEKLLQSLSDNNLIFEDRDILIVKHKVVSKVEPKIGPR